MILKISIELLVIFFVKQLPIYLQKFEFAFSQKVGMSLTRHSKLCSALGMISFDTPLTPACYLYDPNAVGMPSDIQGLTQDYRIAVLPPSG